MTFPGSFSHGTVIDIVGNGLNDYLLERIQTSLVDAKKKGDMPYIPEEFLFLEDGPYIHSLCYHHEKCYQTHDEKHLFRQNGQKIAQYIPANSVLIDLGSGYVCTRFTLSLFSRSSHTFIFSSDLRKVETLLSVLETAEKKVTYLALDLDKPYLSQEISKLAKMHSNVICQGVCGTYAHAISWCASLPEPRVFLWLGSTLFRISWEESLATLKSWRALMGPNDLILAGVDGHDVAVPSQREKVWESYHAEEDTWWQFWVNGFAMVNKVVGEEWFRSEDWRCEAEIVTEPIAQHKFAFYAKRDVALGTSGIEFRQGEAVGWLDAHKFKESDVRNICRKAGLTVVEAWKAAGSEMCKWKYFAGIYVFHS
jgi:uncharacterized SAM-dependent methyltransferase